MAPLKILPRHWIHSGHDHFPWPNGRGPIEGRLMATATAQSTRFHGLTATAPLKARIPVHKQPDPAGLHGLTAMAPLKQPRDFGLCFLGASLSMA